MWIGGWVVGEMRSLAVGKTRGHKQFKCMQRPKADKDSAKCLSSSDGINRGERESVCAWCHVSLLVVVAAIFREGVYVSYI